MCEHPLMVGCVQVADVNVALDAVVVHHDVWPVSSFLLEFCSSNVQEILHLLLCC